MSLNTRGETPQIAFIDWIGFTFKPLEKVFPLKWIQAQLEEVFNLPTIIYDPSSRGWYGYRNRIDLDKYGILAYGGESQRGTYHVELNAHGCTRINDWERVRKWGESCYAKITRIDLAHDDFEGKTVNIRKAIEWYETGGFTGIGRPPKRHLHDDFDSGDGKTLQIGQRENGKYTRIYEKGREQGDPASSWVRVEVELRNKSRTIPWDVVIQPGHYLAGAYPCFSYLSAVQQHIKTVQKSATISYASMVSQLKIASGRALNVMLQVHQGDAAAVLSEVIRPGMPRRLESFVDYNLQALLQGDGP